MGWIIGRPKRACGLFCIFVIFSMFLKLIVGFQTTSFADLFADQYDGVTTEQKTSESHNDSKLPSGNQIKSAVNLWGGARE